MNNVKWKIGNAKLRNERWKIENENENEKAKHKMLKSSMKLNNEMMNPQFEIQEMKMKIIYYYMHNEKCKMSNAK